MTEVDAEGNPIWLQHCVTAYRERERELAERFVGILGMAAWVTPKEELELMRLYAEYRLAREHPLLAAVSTIEAVETPYADAELCQRIIIGTARHRDQRFGSVMRVERGLPLTQYGRLLPAVRAQIDETLRAAERTVAEALTKDRQ